MAAALRFRVFVLRPFRKGDEVSLQENINSGNVTRYTVSIPFPYTMKHARAWIAKNISLDRERKKTEVNFVIDIGGEVAGSIGLRYIEGHKAELGYWLAEKHWGKGIMTKAVRLASRYAFRQLKLRRLYATAFTSNKASTRVLEKSGFRVEGKLRRFHKKGGRLFDALLYAKVR